MVTLRELPHVLLKKIWSMRCFRWLFLSRLYKKVISQSEYTIKYMKKAEAIDETYWIGKLRQFAHVVDKGLHRGDFSIGHGRSGYYSAKNALSKILSIKGVSDPAVQWAQKIIHLYERVGNGEDIVLKSDYVETQCAYEDIADAIKTRRSIRSYRKQSVEKEVLEKIADVMDWAPSSCHRQPGRIYASNNPIIARQCASLNIGASCFTDIYVPLVMIFTADTRLYRMPDEVMMPFVDISLGVQNCLLVAHSLGISLTPLIWSYQDEWQETELRKIFLIPQHFQIVISVVGGYPDGGSIVPPRKRRELFIV